MDYDYKLYQNPCNQDANLRKSIVYSALKSVLCSRLCDTRRILARQQSASSKQTTPQAKATGNDILRVTIVGQKRFVSIVQPHGSALVYDFVYNGTLQQHHTLVILVP